MERVITVRRKAKNLPGQSGGLCAKGAAARQYIYNQERLLYPMKQVGKKDMESLFRISWEEAYQTIAEKLLSVREQYGARSTIFLCRISEMVSSGIAPSCKCVWITELLYRVKHLLSGI